MKPILYVGTALILAATARPCGAQEMARTRVAATVAVQVNEPARSQECRSYAECALRVEPSFFGRRVVRGAEGAPVTRLEKLRGPEMLALFAGNDSASSYAHRFLRVERVNRALTIVGIGFAAGGLAQPRRINGFSVSGAALLVIDIPFQDASERYLSRAVWWYNLRLATPTGR